MSREGESREGVRVEKKCEHLLKDSRERESREGV